MQTNRLVGSLGLTGAQFGKINRQAGKAKTFIKLELRAAVSTGTTLTLINPNAVPMRSGPIRTLLITHKGRWTPSNGTVYNLERWSATLQWSYTHTSQVRGVAARATHIYFGHMNNILTYVKVRRSDQQNHHEQWNTFSCKPQIWLRGLNTSRVKNIT
jgi:hypothetical protein